MAINPATYVKNVGKSFGYAAIEAISSRNQYMSDIKDNADTVKDLYSDIKDFASSPADKIKNNQKLMSYSNDLKDGYKNLISDIKSGNLYNKSRSDEVFSKALGLDFDFDSMFDDIDLDADLEDLSKSTVSTITDSTDREIVAMDTVGSAIANTVSSATARSAEYIVGANAESTRLLMEQNKHLFNTVSTGLIGINKSLGDIQKLGQPLTDHMKNSVTFFTKSTENQEKIITLLTQIADQTKPLEVKKTSGSKGSYESFLTSSGMINLSSAKSLLKKNAKNAVESSTFGMMVGMMDMMGDGSNIGLKAITSNPIGFVLPMIMGSLMDNSDLGKSIDKLGKTLAAFNMKALRNLQKNKYDGGLKGLLAQLFGIEEPGQYKYDTSKYERGVVPFDGETKKAITEVIPDYLSMILSAISGQEQKHYDYSKGKFVSRSSLRKEIEAGNRRFMSSASFDSKREIDESTKEELEEIKYTANDIKKAIDVYVKFAFNTGKYYYIDEFRGTDAELAKTYFGGNGRLAKAFKSYYEYGNNMMSLEHLNARIRSERINQARQERNEAFAHMYNESEFIPSIKVNKPKNQNREYSSSSDSEAASGLDDDIYDIYQRMLNKKVSKNIADKYKNKLQGALNNPTEYSKIYDEILEKYLTEEFTGSNSSKMVGGYTNKVMQFIRKPLDAMAGILDEGSKALYNIMYGKPGEEDKGILGNIFKNIDDMFNKFGDYIKNKFFDPIKKAIEDRGGLKNMIFDMLGISQERVDEIKGNVKSKLKSAGRWVVDNNPIVKAYRNKKGQGSGLLYRGGASDVEELSMVDKTAHEIKNAITSFLSSILPNKEKFAQDNKVVTGVVKDSISELAKDPSGAIAGALIGGGVSLLTGGIVGPLLGASIGAATGLTLNSEKVQTMLFGEEVVDDNGNKTRSGGVLGKELTKFLTQDLKNIAGFGITGAAAALLPGIPGGPVAGLIVGSAIGFANRNNALSNYLFGEKDENGERQNTGLIPKETQDWIKRMLPKGAAGAILGAIAGPFGFVPNILVGAALGFASETDRFKDFIFGKEKDGKREGGITGMIKDKIINPVAEAINPITSEIKYRGKKLIRSLGDKIANVFKTHVGIPLWNKLDKYIMGPLGKVFGGLAKGLLNVATLPFRAIGGIGRSLKNRQVQQGRADYMSAEERIAYRESDAYKNWMKKPGNRIFRDANAYSQFDQYLVDHEDELADITKDATSAQSEIRRLENTGNKNINKIIKLLLKYDWSAARKFNRDFKKNKQFSSVELGLILDSVPNMPLAEKKLAKRYFSEYKKSRNDYEKSTGEYGKALESLSKRLGIKVTSKNLAHIQDMANSQMRHNRIKDEESKNKINENLEESADRATISIDDKVGSILDYIKELVNSIKGHRSNSSTSNNEVQYDNEGFPKFNKGSKAEWNAFQKAFGKEASTKWQAAKRARDTQQSEPESAQGSRLRGWLRGAGSQFSLFGALKTKFARDGQEIVDTSDKDSRATLQLRDKVFGEFETISDYIKRIFDRMPTDKDKEEEKEEKKGFLESILDGITSEEGLLGGFMKWFGGTALGGWMAKFSLKNLVRTALPIIGEGLGIAALGAALTGRLDNISSKIIGTGSPEEENKSYDENGNTLTEKEGTGYGIDSQGNVKEINNRKKGDVNTLSQNATNSAIRGLLGGRGTYSWAAKKLASGATVRTVTNIGKKIADKLYNIILKLLTKLSKNPKSRDKIFNILTNLNEISSTVSKKMATAIERKGAAKAAQALKDLAVELRVIMAVADFITGYEDVRATFGVIDDPTDYERLLSGLFRLVKNQIPILDLIPDSTLINIWIETICPFFGLGGDSYEKLKKRRAEADAVVAKFNEEHGTSLTKNQYIKQEMGDRTTTERFREAYRDTKDDFNLAKGVLSGDKNAIQLQAEKTEKALNVAGIDINNLEANPNWKNMLKATGAILANDKAASIVLPGLLGDLRRVESDIKTAAAKGDIKGIIDVQLKYFEGGGVSENGTQQVETNWMTKYMGNVLLQKMKFDYIGEAMAVAAKNKVDEGFKAFGEGYQKSVDKVKSTTGKTASNYLTQEDFLTGLGTGLRGGSFVSQIDPSLAGKSFGNSTFGANGCAPSVISMITGMPVGAAAGMAESGYANRYGTSADYFGNVLSAAGIPNEYVYTGAGSAQDYLAAKIASGHPTVLLGQDPYNTSKAYSPFGPGNHYVLATGMTRDGGVIVQDPESRTPNSVYDSSILNSVKLGIPTGGRSGLRRRRRLRGGASGYGGMPTDVQTKLGYSYIPVSTHVQEYGHGMPSDVAAKLGYHYVSEGESTLEMTTENCYNENLGVFSMPTVTELNDWIARKAQSGSPFIGQGQVFIDAAAASGLDPRYIVAHAALETGWGTSNFAVNRGNYFGIGAFDSNPGNAYTMGSNLRTGIIEGAKWIARNYYHGKYGQTSVYKMRYNNGVHQYATSNSWVNSIGQIMSGAPRNTKLTLVEGAISTMNDSIDSTSPSSHGGVGYSRGETGTTGTSGGISAGISSFGSLFGKLVASKFGKVAGLFGLSTGDESSEYGVSNGENQNSFESSTSSAAYSSLSSSGITVGADKANNFPYYNQREDPWGPIPYTAIGDSSQTIKTSGCGPTSMAMILRSYGKSYDPSSAASYSLNNGFRTAHDGTAWGYFQSIGAQEGLDVNQFRDSNTAIGYLNKNIPVIATMGPGDFTNDGHFVVLAGTKNDQLLINDPASRERTGKLWPYDKLSQATQFWAISQNGVGSIGKALGTTSTETEGNLRERGYSSSMDGYKATPKYDSRGFLLNTNTTTSSSSSTLPKQPISFGGVGHGRGSGLGNYNIMRDSMNYMKRSTRRYGGSSGLVNLSRMSSTAKAKYMADTVRKLRASGSGTGMGDEVMISMIKAIISLLTNVSANSEYMKVIAEKIGSGSGQNMGINPNNNVQLDMVKQGLGVQDTDSTIAEMVNLLNNLATSGDYAV